ncbi:serine/threonine protein kinase [Stigmatella aurantiaca]|uniref:Protein kinase n=1 Tax=Stigmatella aurantiaca (strain DW4/3-1) TaxID=378806 RepID=Q08WA6_STIAD|nr:serine/threonine-protein kinase [Stigmatella aurantiaca]ADO68520.1 Serine/threonine protein kinase [Stigmatella aurantiaca DW4/3-1]EAU64766.1 protein kinase [Stigmatella aurantiaca DW4/3-1]
MDLLRALLPRAKPPEGPTPPDALPQGRRVGPWRVVRPLGQGGNGTVYLVRRWGRHYALKLATCPGDPRLVREGKLLQRVKHPGVVKLRAAGQWVGGAERFPYLVMEYVEGLPLYEWARQTCPTARQVTRLLIQTAWALEAVHRQHAVHRDVKGGNTLVRPDGKQLVLMDLGAGDYEGATPLTTHVLPPGTEVYLSPEAMAFAQLHATTPEAHYKAGPADDLYSLGVMAYRVLTGQYPFSTHLPRDMFWLAVSTQPARSAREANPRVPEALAAIVHRLLAKQPENRHAHAREVAEALEKASSEGGAEWDEPLSDAKKKAPKPQGVLRRRRAGNPRERAWMWQQLQKKHRLREGGPSQNDAVASAPHLSSRVPVNRKKHWGLRGLVLAIAVGGSLALLTPTRQVGEGDQEIARVPPSPDAGTGAAPFEAPISAPAAPAALDKDDPRVNPLSGSTSYPKLSKVLPLCVGLACAGGSPATRPMPPPEECPPGALQTMSDLGFEEGDYLHVSMIVPRKGEKRENVLVKEGPSTVLITRRYPTVPGKSFVSGRLLVGDRVYGRYTSLVLASGGPPLPVCMELVDIGVNRGLEREPESSETAVKVYHSGAVMFVDRFE